MAPAESERSYHVFYQILANDDIRNAFQLGKPTDYRYLSQSGCLKADGIDDADDFERMQVHILFILFFFFCFEQI